MSTIPYLQGVLKGLLRKRADVVKKLNVKPHFVPLSLNALRVSLHYLNDPDLSEFFRMVEAFTHKYTPLSVTSIKTYKISGVTAEPEDIALQLKKGPLRVINTKGELIGMLYSSYDSAQKGLFTDFLNKELTNFVNKKAYELGSKRKEGFDVGHTYIKADSKLAELADTPLSLQIGAIIEVINTIGDKGVGKEFEAAAKQAYGSLYDEKFVKKAGFRIGANQQANISAIRNDLNNFFQSFVSKHSYGQKVSIYLSKDVKGLLFDIQANIVLIQDREENQGEFAKVEAALREEVIKILPRLHFSKSAEEEMADRLAELVIFGKVISKNVKVTKTLTEDNRTNRVRNVGTSVSSNKLKVKVPRLRNMRGQYTSMASIQALIQLALYETIKKNMVDPALNFRSGRFAGSVQLQNISQDRTGSLLAFLTYMKYPYGTFEPGFAQGSVDRSPTILIDRSVREIALKLVTARMKTVVI